jgi:glycine oxidase
MVRDTVAVDRVVSSRQEQTLPNPTHFFRRQPSYNGLVATDIVIGGGGIIGLSAALELQRSGFRVKVLERGCLMSEASWAAAGMLAGEDPENPEELAPLAALSSRLYPEYLSRVERSSRHSVPLRTRRTLQGTRPNAGFRLGFHLKASPTRRSMDAEEAARRIPGLLPGSRSFLWLEEASLDPRDLCLALPAAASAAGVVLEEKVEVLAVDGTAGSVEIATSAGKLSAGAFLNCCGAWAGTVNTSSPISRRSGESSLEAETVEPRKGQMVTVRLPASTKLAHVLRTPDVYLVPRGDGRVVVGATIERVGFDRQVEAAAGERLLAQAAALWPPVASAPIIDRWAGLRPGTGDGLPLIGGSEVPNCWLATGHFRNGILLAPATALVMRQLIEGSAPEIALDSFSVKRLAGC